MVERTQKAHFEQQTGRLYALLTELFSKPPEPESFPEVELSRREAHILDRLHRNGAQTMSALAAQMAMPLSTLTRVVDRMLQKELIERVRTPEDRRVVQIGLSKRGRSIGEHFDDCKRQLVRTMLEPLSLGEREILLELMAKLVAASTRQA